MSLAWQQAFAPTYSRTAFERLARALYYAVAVPVVVEVGGLEAAPTYTIPATRWTHGAVVRTIYPTIARVAAERVVRELKKLGYDAYPLMKEREIA